MKLMTSADATTSKLAAAKGSCCPSATWNRTRPATGPCAAASICTCEGSTAATLAGAQRCTTASDRMPVPQPTSSQRAPGLTASQSRKAGAVALLQRPMKRS
jgi:hypothetical protein